MFTSIISSIFIAVLFALMLTFAFRRSGPGPMDGFVFFFLIIFIFSWALGGWIEPLKIYQIDYPWLSHFLIGLLIMLLLGALLPPSPSLKNRVALRKMEEELAEAKTRQAIAISISFFFWILFIVLLIVGIVRWI